MMEDKKSYAYTYEGRLEFAKEWCITCLALKPKNNPNRPYLKELMMQIKELKQGRKEGCL